jgi:cell fate (sporulation/competence/biofilm development) regulator YlbF (YheA/YmcA/DUF963 family)
MQEILDLARKLGAAIAASPRYQALQDVRKKLRDDAAATQLLKDFQGQAHKIARLEAETRPVEVADKHRLADLQGRIAAHPILKELMRVQADFSELMTRVNHAMAAPIAGGQTPGPAAEE